MTLALKVQGVMRVNNLPVLIIGAGPAGLLMACALAQSHIPFRIIDKKPARTQASNATWIQTRTLELFDQMGILSHFLKAGQRCDAIHLYTKGERLSRLSLKQIDSIYPFILMLPQSQTEAILEEHLQRLNKIVERSVELIDLNQQENQVTATLRHADGKEETVISDWLIACDGANSLVREQCGFHFSGEDLKEQFIVADADIDFSYLPRNEIHFFFDAGTVLAAFPLGKNRYRLAANLHLDYPRKFFTEREVIETVQERAHGNYYVTNVAWVSPFWIHGKIAEQLQKGRVFLVGDAGHIHSPAGGQGMNTGLQDAYNLAWKLAFVIQEKAAPSLLASYQQERYPVIQETIHQNDYFTKLALLDENFIPTLTAFSERLAKQQEGELEKKIGDQLTQLTIHYAENVKRAPNVRFDDTTLYRYFSYDKYTVLLFTGENATDETLQNLRDVLSFIEKQYANLVQVYVVSTSASNDLKPVIADAHQVIHGAYHVKQAAIYMIRPDTYIAFSSNDIGLASIADKLKSQLYAR